MKTLSGLDVRRGDTHKVSITGRLIRRAATASAIMLALASAAHADSYADGRRDWNDLKTWQNSLSGPYRQGVEWWAGNRSVVGHYDCHTAANFAYGHDNQFEYGCLASRDRLATIDARRNTDPAYRNGFSDGSRNAPWPTTSSDPVTGEASACADGKCNAKPAPIPHVELPTVYVTPDPPSQTPEAACYSALSAMKRIMQRQMNDRDANISFDLQGARYDGQETYRCFLRATYRGDDFRSNVSMSVTKDATFKVEMLTNGRSWVTELN